MQEFLHIFVQYLINVFDVIGVTIVVHGGLSASISLVHCQFVERKKRDKSEKSLIENLRVKFGQRILLALEFFLAGDLIKLIISPTWESLGKLAAIVGIRTILSFFLMKEIKEVKRDPKA